MLNQDIITLLSTLLGGLLTILGGFIGSYYIQSSSSKSAKRKEIRNIIEAIYKDVQKLERKYIFINENFTEKKHREKTMQAMYEVDDITDHIELLIDLYITPLSDDFARYIQELTKNVREAGVNMDKAIEAVKDGTNIHLPPIDFRNSNFRSSLKKILKKEGYSYF